MSLRVMSVAVALVALLGSAAANCGAGTAAGVGTPALQPLSLADCTAIALKNNPQITTAEQGVVSAHAGLVRSRSSYYPQLSANAAEGFVGGAAGAGTPTLQLDDSTNRRETASVAVGQTLWQRGRKENVQQSEASLRAAEFGRTTTVQSLIEQVARDYYGVLAASQLVGVADAGVASAQNHLDQVKARIKLGDAAEVDVYPAEDDIARARLDLIDARSNVRLGLATLKNDMGLPPGTEVQLAEPTAQDEAEVRPLSEALGTAIASRSEVLGSLASVDASRSALALAKIRRGPLADISGQYARDYSEWRLQDWSWDVLLTVSYPIFDGYATKADVTAARAGLASAEAQRQQVINQVGLEVEDALVEVERARERVTASAASVAAADARLAAAEGKYRQGIGILIEVIDARVAVTNARASQVQARYDYRTALVTMRRALGTLTPPGA